MLKTRITAEAFWALGHIDCISADCGRISFRGEREKRSEGGVGGAVYDTTDGNSLTRREKGGSWDRRNRKPSKQTAVRIHDCLGQEFHANGEKVPACRR